jgi:formylglycine-generating enzyme required for sulfatase activity
VFELTRNPLLLTAICLVHRDRGRLPHRRADLYEECIDVLLERWREAKKLPVSVSAKQARRVLQPLARWLHDVEGRTRAPAAEIAPVLEGPLAGIGWRGGSAGEFLRTIRDESGLLTGWSDETYGLMHLGFQEYLAAREVRSRAFEDAAVIEELADHFGESWWREVTLLLLALEDPPLFAPLMRAVVRRPAFARHADLVYECLDDAVTTSAEPFAELLREAPGGEPEKWGRQLVALRVVEKLAPEALAALAPDLARHPMAEIAERFAPRAAAKTIREEKSGCELVLIPAGRFAMGSPDGEEGRDGDEGPVHDVTLSAFYLGRTPVTNAQYARFIATTGHREPEYWANRGYNQPDQPVVGVDWDDAVAFCTWAGGRLPTEAEWEYACRAGTRTRYWSGDDEEDLARVGWYDENSERRLHAVGEKPANPWGLHDMHGNVWEWCADRVGPYGAEPQMDPTGPERGVEVELHDGEKRVRGSARVVRGGSSWDDAWFARSAFRDGRHPADRDNDLGFRVVLPAAPRA